MTYNECLEYLERLGNEVVTMKFGLETIRRLLGLLGNPQDAAPGILVAGTNGKGSVARFLASILSEAGYRTGLYTSPHLVTILERVRIDGEMLSEQQFARYFTEVVEAVRSLKRDHHPTYFETITATAFTAFERLHTEINVLEIGMGGRLDSTNVLTPLVSVLTPIGLDHQDKLGTTIEEIAREKAGIIYPNVPVVSADQPPDAARVLRQVCALSHSPLTIAETPKPTVAVEAGLYCACYAGLSVQTSLPGRHQLSNAVVAVEVAKILRDKGYTIPDTTIETALRSVQPEGTLRRLESDPRILVDGAHNPASARVLAQFVEDHTPQPRTLVLGMMRDKDTAEVARILCPSFDTVVLTRVNSPRACEIEDLLRIVPSGIPVPDPIEALEQATRQQGGTIVVAGSLYLVGKILESEQKRRHST